MEPDSGRIVYLIGIAWMIRKHYDQALDYLIRSFEADPKSKGTHIYLAHVLNTLGLEFNADDFKGRLLKYACNRPVRPVFP